MLCSSVALKLCCVKYIHLTSRENAGKPRVVTPEKYPDYYPSGLVGGGGDSRHIYTVRSGPAYTELRLLSCLAVAWRWWREAGSLSSWCS